MRGVLRCSAVVAFLSLTVLAEDSVSALVKLLTAKGVISETDASKILSGSEQERTHFLIAVLQEKGILDSADVARLNITGAGNEVRMVPAVYAGAEPAALPQAPPPSRDQTTTAPPVVTANRFSAALYGNIVLNSFYDTAATNNQDIPLFASKQGSDALGNDKSFGMTARQTRLGMRFTAPDVAGAKASGQVEVDFFGGKAAFSNGINMDLLRLRIAMGRLDWTNFSLEAGQDWAIFAPLNPVSFAEYAIPSMSASGNPWIRQPQIRTELHGNVGDHARVLWQLAAADPNVGDYPTTTFATSRTPLIGERGRMPAIESRLAFTTRADDRDFTLGLSGHYNRGKNSGTLGTATVQRGVDIWGAAVDWSLPFTKLFTLTGEAYAGRGLGIYSVASGEAIGAVGTAGEHGVFSEGGWAQAQINFTPQWQLNLTYGIDAPRAHELPVGNRNRNQTYMGNLLYKLSPYVIFAMEYRRFLTDFRNQLAANERGDTANLAVVYSF